MKKVVVLGLTLASAFSEASCTGTAADRESVEKQVAELPAGFSDEVAIPNLIQPTAVQFAPDGSVFVAEKAGLIRYLPSVNDSQLLTVSDLRPEVYNYSDRGLLGLAIDPGYPAKPYIYALYTLDGRVGDSLQAGTVPRYGDNCSDTNGCIAAGRLVRITLSPSTHTETARSTLVENWGQQFDSHSLGALAFGPDGMLYASSGEGANYNSPDYGNFGNPLGDPPTPGVSLTPPSAMGGSLRAQVVSPPAANPPFPTWFSGKVVRIDPSAAPLLNPYAIANPPVVAFGLRNPFRMTFRPGSSELWIADVGLSTWEEIDKVADATGGPLNFGWPCYEGPNKQPGFSALGLNVCSSLYSANTASAPFYSYNHANSVVTGDGCTADGTAAITGLAFYNGTNFPAQYQGALFFADFARRCIWYMPSGSNGQPNPAAVASFLTGGIRPTQLLVGPDGFLYYVDIDAGQLHRLRFTSGNAAPQARATAMPKTGTLPLSVTFDGSTSSDPNPGDTLSYAWDLDGDGQFDDSTAVSPSFTYSTAGPINVGLMVTDQLGAHGSTTVAIYPGDQAPVPVLNVLSGSSWKGGDTVMVSGSASDAEDGAVPAAALSWAINLLHCPNFICHTHYVIQRTGVTSVSFVAPPHDYPSYLQIILTATDSAGVSASTTVQLNPLTTTVTLNSDPAGLNLALGDMLTASPVSNTFIQNTTASVSAPAQMLGNVLYQFSSWSDGGAASHDVSVGTSPGSLVAHFVAAGSGPLPPNASAGPDQFEPAGSLVYLSGAQSSDPVGSTLRYAWMQTSGPAVTLSDPTSATPYFLAPAAAGVVALQLTVTNAAGRSASDSMTVTLGPSTTSNLAASGTPVALITAPTGGGNKSINVIRDGTFGPIGSTSDALQYDTYNGTGARTEDWIGYTFPSVYQFDHVVFQEGKQFGNTGCFTNLNVQVRQNGVWRNVTRLAVSPAYSCNGVNFDTYTLSFIPMRGDGIRIDGAPAAGGFISVGELQVYGATPDSLDLPPVADAGTNATVAALSAVVLDGSKSTDLDGGSISYRWSQVSGPSVSLSGAASAKPSFTAPATAATLVFSLSVSDSVTTSFPAGVTITVTGGARANLASAGSPVALITAPTGGGNHNIEVIRDGVKAPVGSVDDTQQYDTYNGVGSRTVDWIGYTFAGSYSFDSVVFQEGKQFGSTGCFKALTVQVRQNGTWVGVSGLATAPAYSCNGVNYETYTLSFTPIVGDGIRIYGEPGADQFVSVGELEVYGASQPPPASTNVASAGTPVALVTAPTGGGNHNIQVIRDGVKDVVGSIDDTKQYDTYNGVGNRTVDWIGYTFAQSYAFDHIVFQEGKQFGSTGCFASLSVQVRQNGSWVGVGGLTIAPAYSCNGVNYETYTLTFARVTGDGIRIYGEPGADEFISVGELEVYGQ